MTAGEARRGSVECLVSDADIAQFDEAGVTVIRGVFSDWVESLRAGVAANMANPSWRERTYRPADGSAPFFQDYCNWSLRDDLPIVGWAVEPGDAVVFQFGVLHGAPANISKRRRRVISLRWVGDDAVYVDRAGPTSPSFPGLNMTPGEPFDAPEFPVIHPRGP